MTQGKPIRRIANPGSALGEAVGVLIENALNTILKPIAESNNCIYITVGPKSLFNNIDKRLKNRVENKHENSTLSERPDR